jgi:hypothetical protein
VVILTRDSASDVLHSVTLAPITSTIRSESPLPRSLTVYSERTRSSISPRALFASPRFQELANFLIVAGIARAADLQSLTVFELKLPAARVRGGADAATFAEQLRDFGGVLLHVAAADQARQHGNITSAVANNETRVFLRSSAIAAIAPPVVRNNSLIRRQAPANIRDTAHQGLMRLERHTGW